MKKVGLLTILIGIMWLISINIIAQEETAPNPVITADNIDQLEQIAMLGRGNVYDTAYSPDGQTLAVATSAGIWLHDTSRFDDEPYLLDGHPKNVTSIEYSPDGLFIASGSEDGTILVWDVQTNEILRVLGQMDDDLIVNDISFSPNGDHLVAGYRDAIVRTWNAMTGEIQFTLEGHAGQILDVAYSPDGQFIASASDNEAVRLWDAETGNIEQFFEGLSIAFSPDGQSLATGLQDGMIQIWDIPTGDVKQILEGHIRSIVGLSYSPDGEFILSASRDDTIRLWDIQTSESRFIIENSYSRSFTSPLFSPGGKVIVGASRDNNLWLYDSQSGEEILTLEGYLPQNGAAFYSPDGQFILSGFNTNIFVWDSFTYQIHFSLNRILSYSLSSDEDSIYILVRQDAILAYDLLTKEEIFSFDDSNDEITRFRLINGRFITLFNRDGVPQIWDLPTGQLVLSFEDRQIGILRLGYSPDAQLIAFATSDEPTIHIVNIQTGEIQQTLEGGAGNLISIRYSDDGQFIIATSDDKNIYVWDTTTGQLQQIIESGFEISFLEFLTYSPTNRLIVANLFEQTLIWDLQTGSVVFNEQTSLVRLSSDGETLAFVINDILNYMNIETGEIIFSIPIVGARHIHFVIEDNFMFVGLEDGSIVVINTQTGDIQLTLEGHNNIITYIAPSPDGRYFITSSLDNTIRIWGIPPSSTP